MTSPAARELHLNVNLLGGLGAHPGAWRWPAADPLSFLHVDSYVELAKIAERGKLDAVFLADSPGLVQDITELPPYNGIEPTITLTAVARATERIGMVGTASTTYNEPYNVARRWLSLDTVSGGRLAWNAVTTYNSISSRNFGGSEPTREERYARGNEFVDVVRALWQSWDENALIVDTATGHFADPGRIRPIGHEGVHFTVNGSLTLPASPQGYPLILQAGGGIEGRHLAARTADVVFSAPIDLPDALSYAQALRELTADYGRDPSWIRITPGLRTFIGGTEEEALRRKESLDDLADRAGAVHALAAALGTDPALLALDRPVPGHVLADLPTDIDDSQHLQHIAIRMARTGKTVRELINRGAGAGLVAVGAPEQIADTIQFWYESGAVDGFNVMPDVLADGLPAFVDQVVPILQRRGLFRTEYRGTTLREHYGLPVPSGRQLAAH
ncbi:MAG TPA: NtaA/DmoA family FMN-dependent monooxygenase [Pseudonocardiaceae bacterium]|jgi:FMN-dependent oxidoreductase (nitrilotriacetate monooxygenase family)